MHTCMHMQAERDISLSSCRHSPFQVSHFLLGPEFDELAWVDLAQPVLEAMVVLDVAVSVLELVQGRLEDLHGTLGWDHHLL